MRMRYDDDAGDGHEDNDDIDDVDHVGDVDADDADAPGNNGDDATLNCLHLSSHACPLKFLGSPSEQQRYMP